MVRPWALILHGGARTIEPVDAEANRSGCLAAALAVSRSSRPAVTRSPPSKPSYGLSSRMGPLRPLDPVGRALCAHTSTHFPVAVASHVLSARAALHQCELKDVVDG